MVKSHLSIFTQDLGFALVMCGKNCTAKRCVFIYYVFQCVSIQVHCSCLQLQQLRQKKNMQNAITVSKMLIRSFYNISSFCTTVAQRNRVIVCYFKFYFNPVIYFSFEH